MQLIKVSIILSWPKKGSILSLVIFGLHRGHQLSFKERWGTLKFLCKDEHKGNAFGHEELGNCNRKESICGASSVGGEGAGNKGEGNRMMVVRVPRAEQELKKKKKWRLDLWQREASHSHR